MPPRNGKTRGPSCQNQHHLKLDKDLVRSIRVLAAENGISVSALVSAKLEEELGRRTANEETKKHALAVLAKGCGRVPTREEMHER
jgi:hypothetical protein